MGRSTNRITDCECCCILNDILFGFQDIQIGVPMSQQRKLRLITLTFLFIMQVSHLIYRSRVLLA